MAAVSVVVPHAANKRGWLTTEFYVTVLTDVGLVAAALGGVLPARWAAIAAGVAQAAYAISRGLSKVNSPAA